MSQGSLNKYLTTANSKWHDVAYWGLLVLACVVMWVLNVLTPFKEDDMAFALIGRGSWHDIWLSQVDHFMTANGRFADVVATLFCAFLGKGAFNVCNAAMFGLMAHLVTVLAARRRSLMVLSLFLAMVACCYPVPGQTMLWLAGSCNYLWAITATLLLVYYLQRDHQGPLGWGRGALLLAGAFIAGNFNEATSFGFFCRPVPLLCIQPRRSRPPCCRGHDGLPAGYSAHCGVSRRVATRGPGRLCR